MTLTPFELHLADAFVVSMVNGRAPREDGALFHSTEVWDAALSLIHQRRVIVDNLGVTATSAKEDLE